MFLPLVKLGALALKTVSRPIANRLKKVASRHSKFRHLIVYIAQANHRITTNMQRRLYGHSTKVEIRPLNEEKAVQAAADLFGELFVFLVAGGAVVFEVQRNSRSEARKEEMRKQELEAMKQRQEDSAREIVLLKQKYNELQKLCKERGIFSIFNFKHGPAPEDGKSAAAAS